MTFYAKIRIKIRKIEWTAMFYIWITTVDYVAQGRKQGDVHCDMKDDIQNTPFISD